MRFDQLAEQFKAVSAVLEREESTDWKYVTFSNETEPSVERLHPTLEKAAAALRDYQTLYVQWLNKIAGQTVEVVATQDFTVGPWHEVAVRNGEKRRVVMNYRGDFSTETTNGKFFGMCQLNNGWRFVRMAE